MSAPLIWILLPAMAAVFFMALRRWSKLVTVLGTLAALMLAWAAWQIPIGEGFEVVAWSIKLADTVSVLGRRFTLEDADRPLLALIYLNTALWFSLAWMARPGELFIPLGLGMVSLLTASLAVDPFLFAALFIQIAVLLSVPVLIPTGRPVGRGVLRFLSFQTLGAPFILFTGWLLAGVEASPGELALVARASILLGLGFLFLLGIFPFHSWIPMLTTEVKPFLAGFIFVTLPGMVALFGIGFLDRFVWLRESIALQSLLLTVGSLMVVVGGLTSLFQKHLGRMVGSAVILEIGLAALAVSLVNRAGVEIFFALMVQRSLSLIFWTLALTLIQDQYGDLELSALHGVGRQTPLIAIGLLVSQLSLAGLPLLGGFFVRLLLFRELASHNPGAVLAILLGSVGLFGAALRTFAVFWTEDVHAVHAARNLIVQIVFLAGLALLIVVGLLPDLFTQSLAQLAGAYPNLAP